MLDARIEHHQGSPLSGAIGRTDLAGADADPARALELSIEFLFVERPPRVPLAPLGERAALVVRDAGADPFRATSALASGVRVGAGSEASQLVDAARAIRTAPCAAFDAALPSGVTLRLLGRDPRGGADGTFELDLVQAPESRRVTATLTLAGFVQTNDDEGAARREALRDTFVLADAAAIGGPPLVVAWPAPAQRAPTAIVLAIVRAGGAPSEPSAALEHARRTRAAFDDARSSERAAVERGRLPSHGETFEREVAAAFRALDVERYQRSGIVFLASQAHAPLALDLALAAESADLDAFVRALDAAAPDRSRASRDARELGWSIERTAFEFLAQRLATNDLPHELSGVLLRHAGEVGRWTGTLQDLVRDARDVDDLARRLERENTTFLEDASPSSRTRAFDWLRARGLAPADYDPLADAKSRRTALEKTAQARERDGAKAMGATDSRGGGTSGGAASPGPDASSGDGASSRGDASSHGGASSSGGGSREGGEERKP